MIELRPLLIVIGTLHVEGGKRGDKDRGAGDVLAAGYFRDIRKLTILHTPLGRLVDTSDLRKVKDLIAQTTINVARFNTEHERCRADNTTVWMHLNGNLRDAVTGWVDRRLRDGDEEVKNALAAVTAEKTASAAS